MCKVTLWRLTHSVLTHTLFILFTEEGNQGSERAPDLTKVTQREQ